MARAVVQAKHSATIISASLKPLIASAIAHGEVLNTVSVCFSSRIRAVIDAAYKTAISAKVVIPAFACSVVAFTIRAAVIADLGINCIDVNEAERVWTILKFAASTVKSIFASATT